MAITYSNVQVTKVLTLRGNTIQNNRYTGLPGELTVDTEAKTIRIHDGVTPGGNTVQGSGGTSYGNANVKVYLTAFDGNISPSANSVYSLGSITSQWKHLYVSSNTIYIGGTALTIANGNLTVGGNAVTGTGGGNVANLWNAGQTLSLNSVGNVTFPTGASIVNGYPGPDGEVGGGQSWFVTSNIAGGVASSDGKQYVQVDNGGTIYIGTNYTANTGNNWMFSQNGIMSLPYSNYIQTIDTNMTVGTQGGFTFISNAAGGATNYNWTFGQNGRLTFPDTTVQQTAFSNTAPIITVLTANSYQQQALIGNLQASAYSNVNVAAYLTTNSYLTSNTANLVNYAYASNVTTANTGIKGYVDLANSIQSAQISAANVGIIGYIDQANTIQSAQIGAANLAITAANVGMKGYVDLANSIQSAQVGAANLAITAANVGIIGYIDRGNTIVTAGITTANTAMKGYVDSQTFYSNARVATYLQSGNIANISAAGNVTATYFLGNGTLLTGVATKTTGSWTVTTGTNTYSFTIPDQGTYQLSVIGNIPNGIIAYNATATITNSNVPVVGAQYAWVYNGGGTPIDFTSIPNQFTGTGNTIVRSNVAPSATTNRFDFGINNTSGGNVTVSYGYVKIS